MWSYVTYMPALPFPCVSYAVQYSLVPNEGKSCLPLGFAVFVNVADQAVMVCSTTLCLYAKLLERAPGVKDEASIRTCGWYLLPKISAMNLADCTVSVLCLVSNVRALLCWSCMSASLSALTDLLKSALQTTTC